MGTNYYLRLKEPERSKKPLLEIVDWRYEKLVADPDMEVEITDHHAVHIAKCSWGWVPSFQHIPANMPFDETEMNNDRYFIRSVEDIRDYMRTGKYEIVDEYGEVYTQAQFEHKVVQWVRRQKENGLEIEPHNHTDTEDSLYAYSDPEGYQFCRTCFC